MNALGTSKAKVLCVFALQTSWAMWGENECHLLRLINKEHADVQLGRICFGSWLSYMLSLLNQADNGKFIWEGIWKWERKSIKDKNFLYIRLRSNDAVIQNYLMSICMLGYVKTWLLNMTLPVPWISIRCVKLSFDYYPPVASLTKLWSSWTHTVQTLTDVLQGIQRSLFSLLYA